MLLFALLGGGSFSGEEIGAFFTFIIVVIVVIVIGGIITTTILNNYQKKRLLMIKEDEENSTDFDRSVSIGDDRCKIYFDSKKKQVMIMRVMTEGIKKEYIDDFEFPGKNLASYTSPVFNIYAPTRRKFLTGTYNDFNIVYEITSIAEKDKNKDVSVNNTIQPTLRTFKTSHPSVKASIANRIFNILLDECHGLMAISESGKVKDIFNYINASDLPKKTGDKSTINTRGIGNYFFIMDDFLQVLVIVGPSEKSNYSNISYFDTMKFDNPSYHEIFNYSDIIEVSYEENGNQLYTKSAGRTVGGAIVGGVLMGSAGAVIGGLSGARKQNKEVKNMDIKILLRNTSRTSCVLHFKDVDRVLKAKEDTDRKLYESYINNANQAKDILSVIIDNAKQTTPPTVQQIAKSISNPTSSIADELAKLAKLKADGILTEDEFQTQKSKLLS